MLDRQFKKSHPGLFNCFKAKLVINYAKYQLRIIDNENNRFRNKYPVFQTPLCAASQGPKPHQSNIICESGLVCFCIGCLVLSSVNQLLLQNKSFHLGKQYCACLLKSQLVQRQSALPTNKSEE